MKRPFVRTLLRGVGLAALVFLVAACGGPTTPTPDPTVNSVTIDGGDRSLAVDETVQLAVTVDVSGGASTDVTWSSDDDTVATVDGSGLVTGVAAGSATITATSDADGSVADTITVTVTDPGAIDTLTIDGGDRTLNYGDDVQLTLTVTPAGAPDDVTWSSSDDGAVSVSPTGLVTAEAPDVSAVITATSDIDPSLSDTITVTVDPLPAADTAQIFVDASALPGGNGSSAYPFLTITEGIAAVDVGGSVNVAAGTYAESLFIDKSLDLLGAGPTQVTIQSDANAPGPGSTSSIDIDNVTGLTLSGFRLEVSTPGPSNAAIGLAYEGGSSDVTIQDVDIFHTNDSRTTAGVQIDDGTDVTLQNVTIEAPDDDPTDFVFHSGAGVYVQGDTTGLVLDGVETSGHESFAGVALDPGEAGAEISNVTITNASTFDEVNKMTVDLTDGGFLTNMDADQFVVAVSNLAVGGGASVYGAGDRFFYKTDLERALLDALFNFNEDDGTGTQAWVRSIVQVLDPADQAVRLNEFVVGSRFDDTYGFFVTRSMFVQAAVDAAAPGATITVQEGRYEGANEPFGGGVGTVSGSVVVDVAGVTITGVGAATIPVISSDDDPVITVDADGVVLESLEIEGLVGVDAILIGTGDNLDVSSSNLLAPVAIDNTADLTVTAGNNWWGDATGPSGTGFAGTGSEVIDPAGGGEVTVAPIAGTAF